MAKLARADYAAEFQRLYGLGILQKPDEAFERIAQALARYQKEDPAFQPFSSKYDAVLRRQASLTPQEERGLALFKDEKKGNCAACHPADKAADGSHPLFTDFTYDNLGVPRNPDNPFYAMQADNPAGQAWIDPGLGGFLATEPAWRLQARAEFGKHKVPTLRNVDKRPAVDFVKAFGHNGYFKSLKEIVHFYNTRDTLPVCASGDAGERVSCWPLPETALNMNTEELGDLGLTEAEEEAIVAFMQTLTDGYTVR